MQKQPTIEVDAETAAAIQRGADSMGLSMQEYLRQFFTASKPFEVISDPDRWLDELVEGLPDLPPLPADFSTKDIYSDHD